MKTLQQGLGLVLLGASLSAVPALQTAAVGAPAAEDSNLVQRMRGAASDDVRVTTERATGKVSFIRVAGGRGDLLPSVAAGGSRADATDKAGAYLDEYARAFGAAADDLVQTGVSSDRLGRVVSYEQRYDGVRVFGTALRAHLDAEGDLTAVNGELVPVGDIDTHADLSADEAGERAVRIVRAEPPTDQEGASDVAGIEASSTEPLVYRTGMVQGLPSGETELVYQVEVGNGSNVREMVFVNADTGKVVNRYSMIHDALDRELYEESPDSTPVWEEGDAFPGALNQDQQNLVLSTGESYWLFMNAFGRDSYDGAGATMRVVNNDPRISCPNANWNGVTTNYCDGVTSDEVVAHEWTHAYTEHTHGLIYQWQSGALNEGYSDVFGETLDLVNGREDEGEGDITAKRTDGKCSAHSPAQPLVTINSPSEIAKDCLTGGASFGQQLDGTGITGDVALPVDAVEEGGTASDGCSPYTNQADVAGKIALVNRGFCPFVQKAQVATAMGASALIIGNNDNAPIGLSGDDPAVVATVSIGLGDRESIRTAIGSGQTVNVTMKDAGGDREDSYRWLIGEKSEAFGGAIRDMWTPTCHGDPGKVSDVEYNCSTDDSGGVHSNSGVVNHGYALLVDGGTFNGVTLDGIGLTKALSIYYRAMTEYQTPISNFVDHAEALEASCADLINQELKELSTDPSDSQPSTERIAAADCAQVTAMVSAVEFRRDPTDQCNWQLLLTPGEPAGCGEGFTEEAFFTEDFEDGLAGWTQSEESVFRGPTFEWESTATYPQEEPVGDGHSSNVALGPAPDQGDCSQTRTDISGANYLTSDDIAVPEDVRAPRMSFDHYVATEVGFDGGNVQLSIDGGDFAAVPAEAFVTNPPDTLTSAAQGNTSPLAGQPGFTGTNPGHAFGSWGSSTIDLAQAGVEAGSTVQVRFAIGRDGCGAGIDGSGWYVDNVKLVSCEDGSGAEATSTSVAGYTPDPVPAGSPFDVEVQVSADEGQPTGRVQIEQNGKVLGTATLQSGVATVRVTKRFKIGQVNLVAAYLGNNDFESSSAPFTVTVVRR